MTTSFENAFAVIIGVDDNQVSRLALPAVAKDVQAVYDVLVHPQRCGYAKDNVRLHTGADATQDNIFDAFFWLQDQIKAHSNATAIVYFSGHGLFDPRAEQYYLIPYDIGEMRRIRQRAIKAEVIGAEIAALEPERLLVVLDCCHADGMDMKNVDLDGPLPAAFPLDLPETKGIPTVENGGKSVSALAQGNGRAILNSSTGAESSYVRRDGTMSVFTYHFIEALTGHAPHDTDATTVLVTDVMSYVTRKVAATARAEGRKQTPVMKTTGVFPVAMLLGGAGTKGIDALPDPLEPLPSTAPTVFNQDGQIVHGDQTTVTGDAHIGQIGNTTTVEGGDYVRGGSGVTVGKQSSGGHSFVTGRDTNIKNMVNADTYVSGDTVQGNKIGNVGRDYVGGDSIHGDVVHGSRTADKESRTGSDLSAEIVPLLLAAAQLPDATAKTSAVTKVNALQSELQRGARADDETVAGLVSDLAVLVPEASEQVRTLLDHPAAAAAIGPITRYQLKRLG